MDDVIYVNICGKEFKVLKILPRILSLYDFYYFEVKNLYLLFNCRNTIICGEIISYVLEDKLKNEFIRVITSYNEILFVSNKDVINIGTKEKIEQDLIFL